MNRHLSSEEFSEWLIGQRMPEWEEHLRTCAGCAAEIEKIQTPLGLFREAVREWSANEERRSVAMPAQRRFGPLFVRVAATAVALAILIAIGIGGQNRRAAGIEREDEMLLGQVQAAVSRPVPATMQPVYDLMVEEGAK